MKKPKLLVIGWDAADWQIINPLMEAGMMPTLKKFLDEGVHGNIATLDPPYSPMLWTTIATGKYPHEHGVLGFIETTPEGDGIRPISAHSRKVKALWNIFNQRGLTSNVVGWWPSNPVENINGVMLSNFYQQARTRYDEPWPMVAGTTNRKDLEELLGSFRVHPYEITGALMEPFMPHLAELDLEKDTRLSGGAKILAHALSIHAATTYLLENEPADFMGVYHDAIDHMCHLAMKYRAPQLEGISDADHRHYKDMVDGMYRFHDMMLERTLNLVDDDTTVMILSDHGFKNDHNRLIEVPYGPATPAIEHREYGMVAIKGPGIKKGEKIFGASLLDITPTLLHIMGLPVGRDMSGKVLQGMFEHPTEPTFIESWEKEAGNDAMLRDETPGDTAAEAFALKQLVELGYLDKREEGLEQKLAVCRRETALNKARSLIHAGKKRLALPILEEIDPADANKYARVLLLSTLVELGEITKAEEQLAVCKQLHPHSTNVKFQEAMLLWIKGRRHEAIDRFEELAREKPTSGLMLHLAKTFNAAGQHEAGKMYAERGLALEPAQTMLLHQKGFALLQLKQYEEALECFLEVIEHLFQHPKAHGFIGECLYHLGMPEQAVEAFRVSLMMAPKDATNRRWLIRILREDLKQEAEAKALEAELPDPSRRIVVVSGLPRSGTSMMMQMLERGGVAPLTDEVRTADESNPHGYYEFEKVKNLANDATFMPLAEGKAIKVIAQLLPYLPAQHTYKIIWMEREISEVIMSQQIMLGKTREQAIKTYPFKLAQTYFEQLERVEQWIEKQPHVDVLRVQFSDAHNHPGATAQRVAEFLDIPERATDMEKAVDNALYRNQQS